MASYTEQVIGFFMAQGLFLKSWVWYPFIQLTLFPSSDVKILCNHVYAVHKGFNKHYIYYYFPIDIVYLSSHLPIQEIFDFRFVSFFSQPPPPEYVSVSSIDLCMTAIFVLLIAWTGRCLQITYDCKQKRALLLEIKRISLTHVFRYK